MTDVHPSELPHLPLHYTWTPDHAGVVRLVLYTGHRFGRVLGRIHPRTTDGYVWVCLPQGGTVRHTDGTAPTKLAAGRALARAAGVSLSS